MNVVGYARISRDEDKENYASIEEQKNIILDYATSQSWSVKKFYIDDNYSGYSFSRPDFSEMLNEVNKGKIDVVIAKDLSRIGRNNGRVLVLIDEFKQMRKNMILVSEMGGTYDVLNDRDDTIGITTWYNERYVKDISRKVRSNFYKRQKDGRLIMGNYFGYIKTDDKLQLVVDEEVRPCIETIFKLYIESGLGMKKICDILNKNYNFDTPSAHYQKKHLERGRVYKHPVQKLWSTYMIKNIITNDVYMGNLRTHKKETISIRGKAIKLPESEHFVFENHHEAIVSKEDFMLANEIYKKRKKHTGSFVKSKQSYIFGGLVVCGECGYGATGMTIRRKVKSRGYECTMYRKYGKARCVFHEIPESRILEHFKIFLIAIKEQYYNTISKITLEENKNNANNLLKRLEKEFKLVSNEYKLLINQKIKELALETDLDTREVIENGYKELEESKKQKIISLKSRIEEIKDRKTIVESKEIKTALEYYDEIINSEVPSRKVVETLIDKIHIYNRKSIQFDLKINICELIERLIA